MCLSPFVFYSICTSGDTCCHSIASSEFIRKQVSPVTFSHVISLPRFWTTLLSRKGSGYMQIPWEMVDRIDHVGSNAKKVCTNVILFLEKVSKDYLWYLMWWCSLFLRFDIFLCMPEAVNKQKLSNLFYFIYWTGVRHFVNYGLHSQWIKIFRLLVRFSPWHRVTNYFYITLK